MAAQDQRGIFLRVRSERGSARLGSGSQAPRPSAEQNLRKARILALISRWAPVVIVLAAWQASAKVLQPIYISTPSQVVRDFASLIANAQLPRAFLNSLIEMVVAIVVAAVIGIGVGFMMGRIRWLERALDPLVTVGNSSPTVALLPLIIIWFGAGELSRIAFITIISLWPLTINTLTGVRAVRRGLRDVGVAFGLGPWSQTWRIYFPATVPYIFAGARIALAVGAVGMILAGQEVGESGLGGLTDTYGAYSETGQLIAVIATTAALALVLFWALRTFRNRAFPWIAATSTGPLSPGLARTR